MEKFKIEAGKYYVTGDGKRYFVGFLNPYEKGAKAHAFVGANETGSICFWREDGTSNVNPSLVAQWVEPKRIRGFIAIKGGGGVDPWPDPTIHGTAVLARECSDRVLAVVEIDVLEGQGLEREAA